MNSNGVVIHSNRLVNNGVQSQNLQDGSSVLVRVASYKGNGVYEGFVAGVKVNISSQKQLQIGQSFPAKIFVKDGLIELQRTNENHPSLEKVLINNSTSEVISTLLNNLGLPADSVSVHIMHQLKQLEAKFDNQLINKIKNLAIKFKGKELSASELMIILKEKNIDFSENDISNLLALLNLYEQEESESFENSDFSLLNKMNKEKKNWLFFPFEFVSMNGESQIESEKLGQGILKALLSKDGQTVNLINIECLYKSAEYIFTLCFSGKNVNKICYYISGLMESERKFVEDKLLSLFKNQIEFEFKEKEILTGTSCKLSEFVSFDGRV